MQCVSDYLNFQKRFLMLHFTVNRNTVVFSGIVQKGSRLHQKAKRLNFFKVQFESCQDEKTIGFDTPEISVALVVLLVGSL